MHLQRRSLDASEGSYCELREPWEEWGSRSSLSQLDEIATQSSSRTEEVAGVRAERDALARALAAERARAASQARAHDARLAELHGVIAELVRRRAQDKQARAIPEEDVSDECESSTQPAGELDLDVDRSRTEQNSSLLSPSSLPTPQEKVDPPDDGSEVEMRMPAVPGPPDPRDDVSVSLDLSEKESDPGLSHRCVSACVEASSCEREHGSADAPCIATADPVRSASREAKLASRVRLKRTDSDQLCEESWSRAAAERLVHDVCAQADLREALLAATHADTDAGVEAEAGAEGCSVRMRGLQLRCSRLQADAGVLQCALARAADTAHRLYCACCVQESVCVGVCLALRAADRALEVYDVLLALAETSGHCPDTAERASAELVAGQLLARLDAAPDPASLASPLLSPGPWLQHASACAEVVSEGWDAVREGRLRAHAARLKAETVTLRAGAQPELFSYHDIEAAELPKAGGAGAFSTADMEAAVLLQEVLAARESTHARSRSHTHTHEHKPAHQKETRGRRRHWLETQASETDL